MDRFDSYKPSGVKWIGEIPSHWRINRLKYEALVQPSNVDKKTNEGEEQVLLCNYMDVYKNEFIDSSLEFMEATATKDEIKKFIIKKGDVLVTKDSETPDDIANPALVIEDLENVICAYHLSQIRPTRNNLLGEYLFRLFQDNKFKAQFEVTANGVTRYGLSVAAFTEAFIPLPTTTEQTAIATYLDKKTAQIDKLITNKQKLIELLREERMAVINEAVSGKGNEWERKKLKYLLKPMKGALKPGPFGSDLKNSDVIHDGPIKVYTQRNVIDNDFETGEDFITDEKFKSLSVFEIDENDILVTTRGTIGRTAIFPSGARRGILHPCLIRIQIDESKILNEWLIRYFNESTYFQENVKLNSNSTVIDVIYGYTLREISISVPEIKEQQRILKHMQTETQKIDTTISKIEKEIELMQEYRTALISEVVTGKIKV